MGDPADRLSAAEEEITDALLALSRVFVATAARSLARLDDEVTLPQFRTLVVLVSRGPQRIADLAAELDVSSSTATRMCDRLTRRGLVARHVRADDRRAAWVALTTTGRDLVGEAMALRREAIADLVRQAAITRPLVLASVLDALVEIAGELPSRQWLQRWENAAHDSAPVE